MKTVLLLISIFICCLAKEKFSIDNSNKYGIGTAENSRSGKIFIRPLLELIKTKLNILNDKIGLKLNLTTSTTSPTTASSQKMSSTTTKKPSASTQMPSSTQKLPSTTSKIPTEPAPEF